MLSLDAALIHSYGDGADFDVISEVSEKLKPCWWCCERSGHPTERFFVSKQGDVWVVGFDVHSVFKVFCSEYPAAQVPLLPIEVREVLQIGASKSDLEKFFRQIGQLFKDLRKQKYVPPEVTGETTREVVIDGRKGQEGLREKLLDYWENRCAVTEVDEPEFLIASHIKPWKDASDAERLDPNNGLLLCVTLDKAFDRGFISFDDEGSIIFSRKLSIENRERLHLDEAMKLRKFDTPHSYYMNWHRTYVFRA